MILKAIVDLVIKRSAVDSGATPNSLLFTLFELFLYLDGTIAGREKN